MAEANPQQTIAILRKLQILAPISMLTIAGLIFWLWKDDMAPMIAGVIALLAIPDFILFKLIADRMEAQL